jgi:hypothetical protein
MVGPHRFLPLLTHSGYCPHSVPGFKLVKALVWTPYPTYKVLLSYGFKHDEKGVQLKIIWIKKNKGKEKHTFLRLPDTFRSARLCLPTLKSTAVTAGVGLNATCVGNNPMTQSLQ